MDTAHPMQLYGLMDLRAGSSAISKRVLSREQLVELSAHCQAVTLSVRCNEPIVLAVRHQENMPSVYTVRTESDHKLKTTDAEQVLAIYLEGDIVERVETSTTRFFDYGIGNNTGYLAH